MKSFTTCVLKPLPPPPPLLSRLLPKLILQPIFKGGDMDYTVYDLEDGKVKSQHTPRDGVYSDEMPPDGARLVGSSHGWVASFDESSSHVFLSNPISGRHIKLPPTNTLRDPYIDSFKNAPPPTIKILAPSRVILSCSPDDEEEECRAMMAFGPGGRLAFCVPGVSTEWTPLGYNHFSEDLCLKEVRPHEDIVYCSGRKVFASITTCKFDLNNFYYDHDKKNDLCDFQHIGFPHSHMLYWDIENPNFEFLPSEYERIIIPSQMDDERIIYCVDHDVSKLWEGEHLEMLRRECIQMPHLVSADQLSDQPLVVLRFVNRERGYTTVCFLVLKIDDANDFCFLVVEDLKGLAIFVGMNHSFAVPATGVLKPNSIYYTDDGRITPRDAHASKLDCGIFDYDKKIIFPYYNVASFNPPMLWLTPSPI
ncbi:hypothetical protein C2S52_018857 [Perilla frutescens var. hirtella]|nr:hypothetical protein C2S52_018857 [Perilla frutescens var. hirtella]